MTTFILHGGFTRHKNELNDSFYREFVKDLQDGATILLVYFATDDKEKQKECLAYQSKEMTEASQGKIFKFVVASPHDLEWQLTRADAVYFQGGDTEKLIAALKRYSNLNKLLEGKVIAGSSAGAYALSTYYYSNDKGGIHDGLGVLPLRTICHHESDRFKTNDNSIAMMEHYPSTLDLITLRDYEWKEFIV